MNNLINYIDLADKCGEFAKSITDAVIANIDDEINTLRKENEFLRNKNNQLTVALRNKEKSLSDISVTEKIINYFINSINDSKCTENKEDKIYALLDIIFNKDYIESVTGVPLWLGVLTQYYSHKDFVIEILKLFNVELSQDVYNFRLPSDWSEDELDIFFNTIYNHYNCNGCFYANNLKFWGTSSLDPVKIQCERCYSEIPWQYLLRNPLLRKEKYLAKIGKEIYTGCPNYEFCFKIEDYQQLTDEELKYILNNMVFQRIKKFKFTDDFILKHVDLIDNANFVNVVYERFKRDYSMEYKNYIFKFPFKYVEKWLTEVCNEPIKFIEKHKELFTEIQRKQLLTKLLNI